MESFAPFLFFLGTILMFFFSRRFFFLSSLWGQPSLGPHNCSLFYHPISIFLKCSLKTSVAILIIRTDARNSRANYVKWCASGHAKSLQSCPTLCEPMDCSPPGSSVHGILQARILEWVAVPLLQGMFLTQGSNSCLSHVSALAGGFFTTSTTYLNGISSMNFKMSVSFPHQIKTIFVL